MRKRRMLKLGEEDLFERMRKVDALAEAEAKFEKGIRDERYAFRGELLEIEDQLRKKPKDKDLLWKRIELYKRVARLVGERFEKEVGCKIGGL